MFQDQEYIAQTAHLISGERARIFEELSSWDTVKVYRPFANFILMRILKEDVTSDQLFDHCIRQCMMIRDCSTFPFLDDKYVRFCMMKPDQNDRLLEAFKELLG